MKKIFKDYGLSIVLSTLFLLSWVAQTFMGWQKFASEQTQQGSTPEVFGQHGYIWSWGESTFENWQSEFLQLLSFVVLTSFLIHKGSHESKDGDEEMKAMIENLTRKVDELGGGGRKQQKAS